MNTYFLNTTTTMKDYNREKYWIDSYLVKDLKIQANNIEDALKKYKNIVGERFYILISDNAIKNKSAMYIDTKAGETIQTGYVITGKTGFENNYKWTEQYIDLWIEINVIENPFVEKKAS